ncbi:hypothetical protein KJ708_09275 [bacterium]|nr:hypothetical protein [bacterium]MBU1916684.1 hypothetical protein [bacterium]
MRLMLSIVLCLFIACSQAGFYDDPAGSINSTEPSYLIKGYLGVGALNNANISIIDVSDYDSPELIETTISDSNGFFEFSITDDNNGLILVVANGGNYIDPFSYNTISGTNYEIRALYKSDDIVLNNEVYITPFSTLFSELFDCLYHQSSLNSDPYIYSKSIFNDVFGVDMSVVRDVYLNAAIEDFEDKDTLYTLYNLAFSKMAKLEKASSGLDILSVFADELAQSCTLMVSDNVTSLNYSFHRESFRGDFLDALLTLKNDKVFASLATQLSLDSLVVFIRNKNNLIFGFNNYEDF